MAVSRSSDDIILRGLENALHDDPLSRLTATRLRLCGNKSKKRLIEEICADSKEISNEARPYDYALFLKRMQTFSPSLWFAKPALIGATACSLHGWTVISSNCLRCGCCQATLDHDDRTDTLGTVLSSQLISGHEESCVWRIFSSPEAFTSLPYQDERMIRHQLKLRMQSFKSKSYLHLRIENLARIQEKYPLLADTIGGPPDKLKAFLSHHFGIDASEVDLFSPTIVTAAICGWTCNAGGIMCDLCGRSIQINRRNSSEFSTDEQCQVLKLKDGLSDHRTFCPWTSNIKDGTSGWDRCCGVIDADLSSLPQNRPASASEASDAYKRIRSVLDMASSFRRVPAASEI